MLTARNHRGDRRSAAGRDGDSRRGMSLMVVMVALSTTLVLTYTFLRSQSAVMLVSSNSLRRDLALQAAQTGAAVAVERMQTLEWAGVSTPLTSTLLVDAEGTTAYRVEFLPVSASGADASRTPYQVKIRSTGSWTSTDDASAVNERVVEVIVELRPRLPGRSIRPGDSAAASDLQPNPGDFDQLRQYAAACTRNGDSLTLDPCARIDGAMWVYDSIRLFQDPAWGSGPRSDLLKSIGARYVSGSAMEHPHPLGGTITFRNNPVGWLKNELADLKVSWNRVSQTLEIPSIDFSQWGEYRLYSGGFEYAAQSISGTLQNVELRPTPANPLGIFYRNGSVRIASNVTIQGTLVATGRVTLDGTNIRFCSWDGCDLSGELLVDPPGNWPRLPAIVANDVFAEREIRARIDGAVVVKTTFNGAGGDLDLQSGNSVNMTVSATVQPATQPYSRVQLSGSPNLNAIDGSGKYAIWIPQGSSGNWYSIVGVDAAAKSLMVVGEVTQPTVVQARIARARRNYLDVYGPVIAERIDLNRTDAWADVSGTTWGLLRTNWGLANTLRVLLGQPKVEFVDYLADPSNFLTWGSPYRDTALSLEPTSHLRARTDVQYQFAPPLFRPYPGSGGQASYAGYRWKILSWRLLP